LQNSLHLTAGMELDESAEVDGASVLQTLVTRTQAVTAPVELAAKALAYESQDLTLVTAGCVIVSAQKALRVRPG
jgi:hypothetical protein